MSQKLNTAIAVTAFIGAILGPPTRLAALSILIYYFVPYPRPSAFLSVVLAFSATLVFGALRDSLKDALHGE